MSPLAQMYRDRLVRVIVTDRPAMTYRFNEPTALEDFCSTLADTCDAKRLLRAKGYGEVGMAILEIVQLPPHASEPLQRKGRKRRR